MTVKELKEKLMALPDDLDSAEVFVYSRIDEGADRVYSFGVYNEETYNNNVGVRYCRGHEPWNFVRDEKDKSVTFRPWQGSPAFVVIG